MILRILAMSLSLIFWSGFAAAENGEKLFKERCVACHGLDGARRVGPALNGVSDKKPEDWLIGFIKSPQKYINEGDEYAKKLYEEYNQVLMPDQDLSDSQVKAILAYIKSASEGGDTEGVEVVAEAEEEASPEDVALGKELFQGTVRFAKGGAACNACHDVQNDEVLGGGVLATGLTTVFSRIGGGGVKAILAGPPFPVMQQAYKDKELTDGEIKALMGFLQNVDKNHYKQPKDYGMGLFLSGVLGTIFLFIVYSFLWSNRKRGTVYKEIFDRQVKARWE